MNSLILIVSLMGVFVCGQTTCDPLTASCPPFSGLNTSTYSVDFTSIPSLGPEWTIAGGTTVAINSSGLQFTFQKRHDAPYIWTSFQILFGRIEVVVQAAPGTGIITGAVLMSDDQDEIDWEWSGNNFGGSAGKVQTNYFGKGITGSFDRGSQPAVDSPTTEFHTYTLDWTPSSLTWSIDGVNVRTLTNNNEQTGPYQYPQTPSRLHLGVWDGGDPDGSPGVIEWAGGVTDFTKVPFTAYVKSVEITTPNPCSTWQYPPNFSGKWQDVICVDGTEANSTSQTTPTPTSTQSTCSYTVVAGDYGYVIATKLGITFESLEAAQTPSVDWTQLQVGQVLSIPGPNCPTTNQNNTAISTTSSSSTATPNQSISRYTVQRGDSGYSIVAKLGVSFDSLGAANPGVKWDSLQIGQILNIPLLVTTTLTACPFAANATSPTLVPQSSANTQPVCNHDLCLRGMLDPKQISSMQVLCPMFISNTSSAQYVTSTTSIAPSPTSSAVIPPGIWASCSNNTARISRACQCLLNGISTATTPTTPTPPPSATSTPSMMNPGARVSSLVQGNLSNGGKLRLKLSLPRLFL